MKNMFISDYTENEFNKKDQECEQLLGKIKKTSSRCRKPKSYAY